MCLSINKHFIISSCQQLPTEMLHINHHSYSFWTEDLSQTRGGIVNFESEVSYDFLIPSTTRGQSVIVSQNNGIIALIFDIWNIKAVGLFRRGNDSWKKHKGAALFLVFVVPCISCSSSDFSLCLPLKNHFTFFDWGRGSCLCALSLINVRKHDDPEALPEGSELILWQARIFRLYLVTYLGGQVDGCMGGQPRQSAGLISW